MQSERIIITAQAGAMLSAVTELQTLDTAARPEAVLSSQARLLTLPGGFIALLAKAEQSPPVFIRHWFPVTVETEINDIECEKILADMIGGPASIQMRASDKNIFYTKMTELIKKFEQNNFQRSEKKICSLFLFGSKIFAGMSGSEQNRSKYNGGEIWFKKMPGQISRAEFKLLEAFHVFEPDQTNKNALDLGAAPGGWTNVLLERGYDVTAVDPAEMDGRLLGNPRLTHIKSTVQHAALKKNLFSLILNDMRMDYAESCRIMNGMSELLAPNGSAIMTLKLPSGKWLSKTKHALSILSGAYTVADARQLFHNRSEATVFLKKNK